MKLVALPYQQFIKRTGILSLATNLKHKYEIYHFKVKKHKYKKNLRSNTTSWFSKLG